MNLVLDWGNTSLKAGWFDGPTLLETLTFSHPEAGLTAIRERPRPRYVISSSTGRPAAELQGLFGFLAPERWLVMSPQLPVPIRNGYETPHTLGADRLAGAVGASALFPAEPCLILDLGTCLTADLLDGDGVFQGGLIAPGLRMRLEAMHAFTARLPLLTWAEPSADFPALTAKTTEQAMLSGALNGLLLELSGLMDTYRARYPNLRVLLCGGDAPTFESRLKPPIFVVSELVLIGLNRILLANVKNLQADS